jgi:hypothetical protein
MHVVRPAGQPGHDPPGFLASGSVSPSPSDSPSPSISASPSATPIGATLASGLAFPEGCPAGSPEANDTAAFVVGGRAWAVDVAGSRLTCLFEVADAGPFAWGPLGDRVLVSGLEVVGVAGGPSLAPSGESPAAFSWAHPTGKTIVFASGDGSALQKVHLDGAATEDVSPLANATYLSVTYHPSGVAFAVAVERGGSESIWISSNQGADPHRLVFSIEGTTFGAMGFAASGRYLYYAAEHADGHPELHLLDLGNTSDAPVLWEGEVGQQIFDVWPASNSDFLAWTAGSSCTDQVAMMQGPGDADTRPILPDAAGPTRALGWLDDERVLVATGPCEGPFDLAAINAYEGSITAIVSGVDLATTRAAAVTPPPPPPPEDTGGGFA